MGNKLPRKLELKMQTVGKLGWQGCVVTLV